MRTEEYFEIPHMRIHREDLIDHIGELKATKMSDEDMKEVARLVSLGLMHDWFSCVAHAVRGLSNEFF